MAVTLDDQGDERPKEDEDMRRVMLGLMGLLLMAGAVMASDDVRVLDDAELRSEMRLNDRLASYVERNGYPDVVERRFLSDERPWDEYQVTLYYLDIRNEISFARAYILGEPSIHLEKNEQPLTDEQVARLRPLARTYGLSQAPVGSAVERAESSAARAEAAADRVDAAATVAERAADRAEAVVAKMETAALRRHK